MNQPTQNKPIKVINTRTAFNQNLDSLLDVPMQNNRRDKKHNRQSKEQQKYERMARDYYCGY
jgi:hypothetical protein